MILEANLLTEMDKINRTLNQIKQDIINQKIFLLLDNNEPISMVKKSGKKTQLESCS